MRSLVEARFDFVVEDRLPHDALLHKHGPMRAAVIMNRRALPRFPTQHQHLDKLVLHHAMA